MEKQEESGIEIHESGTKYKVYQDENGKDLRVFASDSASRLEFEEYDEYRFRRQVNKYMEKQYKKGHYFWPSVIPTKVGYIGNTYNKERAEEIKQTVINKLEENGKEN
jgi:hypothetical protein